MSDERSPLYPDEVLSGDGEESRVRRTGSTARMVIDALRHRPVPRRILGILSILLFLGGGLVFAYPFLTDVYAGWKQGQLEEGFGSDQHREAYAARTIQPGEALTKLTIPKIGVETIVVEGTSLAALRAGSGHYEKSALPCETGNSAIAGHRTTYSKPFAEIDELKKGDRIILETPVGRCFYRVTKRPFATTPFDTSVLKRTKDATLTLTTCHPPGSAAERLIVKAKLVRSEIFSN
jgi:sortase A